MVTRVCNEILFVVCLYCIDQGSVARFYQRAHISTFSLNSIYTYRKESMVYLIGNLSNLDLSPDESHSIHRIFIPFKLNNLCQVAVDAVDAVCL